MSRPDLMPLPPIAKLPALSMGVQGCAPVYWLDGPDAFGDQTMRARQLAEKKYLLSEQAADVFDFVADGQAAALEASQTIASHLYQYHNMTVSPEQAACLRQISALIPEDVLVISRSDDSGPEADWMLTAASLCFPSHWHLSEKMGQSITAIHAPVPGFTDRLAKPVNRFFTAMLPGCLSQRLNWSVQSDDRLFAPSRAAVTDRPRSAEAWGEVIHIRIERQCFYKLPESRAVLFTIRTSLAPLNRFRQQPEFVDSVRKQTDKLSPAFREYKNISAVEEGLRVWIDNYLPRAT